MSAPTTLGGRWESVPARRLLIRQSRPVPDGAETVTAFRDGEVVARSKRRIEGFTESTMDSGYQGVEVGDLVVHSMDGFAGAIGVSTSDGKMSPVVHIYRSNGRLDLRFAQYFLRHLASTGYVQALAKGIRERSTSFDPATLADLPIPVPPMEEQRRIADFLDEQIVHLDQAAALRQAQLAAFSATRVSAAQDLLAEHSLDGPPMSSVARLVDTEHKTAPDGPSGGYFIAGTNAIRNGRLMEQQLREIDAATFEEWTSRATPRVGDLLLTREAPIGQVALLTDSSNPPAIGQRVVLIRPEPGWTGEYMRLVLMSPVLDRLVRDKAAGSLHPHLNMSDVRRLRVPELTSRLREELGVRFTLALGAIEEVETAVVVALNKLSEYKRSLITAAVTGELDVTTARRGIPA